MKLLRKHAPQLKWVISFADATQCGDGTIYRASGFILTGIKDNSTILLLPDGSTVPSPSLSGERMGGHKEIRRVRKLLGMGEIMGSCSRKEYIDAGAKTLSGFQLRYIYFIDKSYREHLAVPELPYSAIEEAGARMYKGVPAGEAK